MEEKKVKNGRVITPKFVYLIQWIKRVFIGVWGVDFGPLNKKPIIPDLSANHSFNCDDILWDIINVDMKGAKENCF